MTSKIYECKCAKSKCKVETEPGMKPFFCILGYALVSKFKEIKKEI